MDFPGWIRRIRQDKGLSSTECAQRAGVSQSVWSEWEGKESEWQPRRATVEKIANGLELEVAAVYEAAGMSPDERPDRAALAPFAERLRSIMAIRRMGATELAERIGGVSAQSVSAWTQGHNAPRFDKIAALARELSVSADWLLGDENAAPPITPTIQTDTVDLYDLNDIRQLIASLSETNQLLRDFSPVSRQNNQVGARGRRMALSQPSHA